MGSGLVSIIYYHILLTSMDILFYGSIEQKLMKPKQEITWKCCHVVNIFWLTLYTCLLVPGVFNSNQIKLHNYLNALSICSMFL